MTDRTHTLLMTVRQALIMILGAIEDYLGKQRSIVPRRKREKGTVQGRDGGSQGSICKDAAR